MTKPFSHKLQRYVFPAFLAVGSVALSGASCDKKSAASPDQAENVVHALDPADETPLPGVDISKLDDKKKERFYELVSKQLESPCGKAHYLRESITSDQSCKRAPFAARYVAVLLEDENSDEQITQLYEARYKDNDPQAFDLNDNVPRIGPGDAPVKLVEFYDYGCPSCKEWAPIIDEAIAGYSGEVAVFFKMFPLPKHTDSGPAAQAALAAMRQGKFVEMHKLLFEKSYRHKKSDLLAHALSLGLDMTRFESDYAAAATQVESDKQEGDKAGVTGTPFLFINGRLYRGLPIPDHLKMWIDEELAVNR